MGGAAGARATGGARGATFQPSHGLTYDASDPRQHAERYAVTGILAPTGTPDDRVIYIPIEGVFRMGGHELRGSGEAVESRTFQGVEIPDEHKEVSAVLLRFRRGGMNPGLRLNYAINRAGERATLAWPIAQVVAGLHRRLFWAIDVLRMVAAIVAVVAGGALLASLYNTMNERRRELAVLRALGASRSTVFGVVVLEAVTIAALGSLLGYAVHGAILWRVRGQLLESTGVLLRTVDDPTALLWTPFGMVLIGAFAGALPAIKAYATDTSRTLAQSG